MIGISSSWFAVKGMPIKESIERGFELGFELVEIGAAHKCEDGAIETVLELRKKYPNKSFTLHALFPPFKNKNGNYPLNLADPKEHDRVLKVVKKMFDISERIGAEVIGIHGGYAARVKWVEGKFGFRDLKVEEPIALRTAKRNMDVVIEDLAGLAEERNIKLAIEISPPASCMPLTTNTETFEQIFSNFNSHLGLLLDIGHLHLSARKEHYDPYEFVRKFKNKIFEIHLHDVKDSQDHIAVGTGEIDFEKYFKIIGRPILEKIPMVFEYNNLVAEQKAPIGKALTEKILSEL